MSDTKFIDADKIRELVKDPNTKYIPCVWLRSLIDQHCSESTKEEKG